MTRTISDRRSRPCRAQGGPATCYYHRLVFKMEAAQEAGNFEAYSIARDEIEAIERNQDEMPGRFDTQANPILGYIAGITVQKHADSTYTLSYPDGKTERYLESQHRLHSEEGPAVVLPNGTKKWYSNGTLHRTDGPAVEEADGTRQWMENGQLHRVGQPAYELSDGGRGWYQNDQLHRLDGPAVELANGYQAYWMAGRRHRDDGPAIINPATGIHEWYQHGELVKAVRV